MNDQSSVNTLQEKCQDNSVLWKESEKGNDNMSTLRVYANKLICTC